MQQPQGWKTILEAGLDVFLPASSVTEDYLAYALSHSSVHMKLTWPLKVQVLCEDAHCFSTRHVLTQLKDNAQSLTSSIAGLLANRAVLQGTSGRATPRGYSPRMLTHRLTIQRRWRWRRNSFAHWRTTALRFPGLSRANSNNIVCTSARELDRTGMQEVSPRC